MVFFVDGGAQKDVRDHLDFVLVNLPTFDAHSGMSRNVMDLDVRMAELTSFFSVFSFNIRIQDITFATSLDAAMAAGTKDFCLIQNCGHLFYGYDQLSFDMKAAMNDCDFITGHIMDRGGYFYMHDQCMLVNRRTWEKLGKPSFGTPNAGKKPVALPHRSPENVHDNYTPLFLEPTGKELPLQASFGYGWNAISEGLKQGHKIFNWPKAVRQWKRHCYAYYGDPKEWITALADVTKAPASTDEQLGKTVTFLRNTPDKADAPRKVFVFNSETDADIPCLSYRRGLDCAFVLASGFKTNRVLESLGFTATTEIVVYDYSAPALALRRLMVEEWDGRDYGAFFLSAKARIDTQFTNNVTYLPAPLLKDAAGIDQEFRRELGTVFTSMDHWLDHWQRYKALKHTFVELDVLSEQDKVRAMIDAYAKGNTMMWISDMFNSPNAVGKFDWNRRKMTYKTLTVSLAAATDSYLLLGGDPRLWLKT